MLFNVSSLFYMCRLYGFQSSLSWKSAFYQDMKSKNDKVGGYWILDFIEIWISLWCAWLNFEQFSGHITFNFKCTSLHWHCKWIEWKSSLTFVEWCVWTGICIYRVCWSGREVPSGLIETGYLLTLRLYAILDGRSIFTYVWNWLYNIIVTEVITKTRCTEQFCEKDKDFTRCLVMRIPVDNTCTCIYTFVMVPRYTI